MESDAMTLAMKAFRSPSSLRRKRTNILPGGMLQVIKAAAGDDETLALQASLYKTKQQDVREAARHYLLHYILDSETRGVRLLGLPENASETEMKDHKRWLLKWLHPDRNPSVWEQKLFQRISEVRIDNPQPPPAEPVYVERRKHTDSRRRLPHARRAILEERRRDSSVRRVLVRVLRPLIIGSVLASGVLWTIMSTNKLTALPLNVLSLLSRG